MKQLLLCIRLFLYPQKSYLAVISFEKRSQVKLQVCHWLFYNIHHYMEWHLMVDMQLVILQTIPFYMFLCKNKQFPTILQILCDVFLK